MSRVLTGLLLVLTVRVAAGEEPVDFNREVRPILSESCYTCHGPDNNQRKAKLRLDTKDGLFADRGGYAVVEAGKPADSELLERITSDEPDYKMPPGKGHGLSKSQVDTIRRWIAQGAKWNQHWAYSTPVKPQVPPGAGTNEIDRFIRAKLLEQKLTAAKPADKVTLIRRLYFDLIGLPPTPEQVKAFVDDSSPDAYEKVVDQLLSSEHYGERMAMYWLDLVRYADTNGIHGDNHRDVYLYRDYVIQAFNENKPFDQFTVEQLAGDLLPNRTTEQWVASGYNRMLMTTREGGAQAKEYRAKYAADRVRNVTTVWLASTVGCAECHDHKFDPFSSKDFYSIASFFADIQETAVGQQPGTPILSAQLQATIASLDKQIAEANKTLGTATPELAADQAKWEQTFSPADLAWKVITPKELKSQGGATLKVEKDGSILASGKSPVKDVFTLTFAESLKDITGIRLQVLPDNSLPGKGPGRASNGNFVLNEFKVTYNGQPVSFSGVTSTHNQESFPAAKTIDGNAGTGWAILPKVGQESAAVYETKTNLGDGGDQPLQIEMHFNYGSSHVIGHFQISVTSAPRPVKADGKSGPPKNVLNALAVAGDKRTDAQKSELAKYYRTIAPRLEPVRKRVAQIQAEKKKAQSQIPTTLVSTAGNPREMRVLPRGNWLDDSGQVVQPSVPGFLPPLTGKDRATRLDLAKWVVDKNHPLTSRVMVNRLWKLCFGNGLVTSLDDFGSQGTSPSHPELLDWLAVDFVENGWNIKRSLKQMVMSKTYQQSSRVTPQLREIDPYNQWLARQARFRLDAEMVRDNALSVSGLIVHQLGGPSAKPYQPAGYWKHLNFPVGPGRRTKATSNTAGGFTPTGAGLFCTPACSLLMPAPVKNASWNAHVPTPLCRHWCC